MKRWFSSVRSPVYGGSRQSSLKRSVGRAAGVGGAACAADAVDAAGTSRGAHPSHGSNSDTKKLLGSTTSAPLRFGGIGVALPPTVAIVSPARLTASTTASM